MLVLVLVSISPAPPFSGGSSASGPPAEPGYLVGGPTSRAPLPPAQGLISNVGLCVRQRI